MARLRRVPPIASAAEARELFGAQPGFAAFAHLGPRRAASASSWLRESCAVAPPARHSPRQAARRQPRISAEAPSRPDPTGQLEKAPATARGRSGFLVLPALTSDRSIESAAKQEYKHLFVWVSKLG